MPLLVCEENADVFGPLALTRATFELRAGALCPLERALAVSGDVALRCREELAPYLRAKYRLPVNEDREGEPFPGLPAATPWGIISQSNALIAADFEAWNRQENFRDTAMMNGAHIVGARSDVHIGRGAVVQPGCVLDATGGPIIIAPDAHVKWSQIQGPVFVGEGCSVDGARLRPGTSLGPHCKVGGEISASIFQSRVNKAHEGFVGHSWAGRWVNFGALATTSNMKNTLGPIRVQSGIDEDGIAQTHDTGAQFLGSLVGDHTKIGIGQMLTTGSYIGIGGNIFGGGVAPKWVPSFAWGGEAKWSEYRFDDCLKTVRAALSRRNAVLRPESEELLRVVFRRTAAERSTFLGG